VTFSVGKPDSSCSALLTAGRSLLVAWQPELAGRPVADTLELWSVRQPKLGSSSGLHRNAAVGFHASGLPDLVRAGTDVLQCRHDLNLTTDHRLGCQILFELAQTSYSVVTI